MSKYAKYQQWNDMDFWARRHAAVQEEVFKLQDDLASCQKERDALDEKLNVAVRGTTLRDFLAEAEKQEADLKSQTRDAVLAWQAGITENVHGFPELAEVFTRKDPMISFRSPSQKNVREGVIDMFKSLQEPANRLEAELQKVHLKTLADNFISHFATQFADPSDTQTFAREEKVGSGSGVKPDAETSAQAEQSGAQPSAPPCQVTPEQGGDEPRIPGAFNPPSPSSLPAVPPVKRLGKGGYRHVNVSCDGCHLGIRGVRFKCQQCPDYDLCGGCVSHLSTAELHPEDHKFRTIFHPQLEKRVGATAPASPVGKAPGSPPNKARHVAYCDVCRETIYGVRHKCLSCPDWDACEKCAESMKTVHPGHPMVKLYTANDFVVNDAKLDDQVKHSDIICDGCDHTIRGVRYKCMDATCPDFDLCADCEASPHRTHPAEHPLLKLRVPCHVTRSWYSPRNESEKRFLPLLVDRNSREMQQMKLQLVELRAQACEAKQEADSLRQQLESAHQARQEAENMRQRLDNALPARQEAEKLRQQLDAAKKANEVLEEENKKLKEEQLKAQFYTCPTASHSDVAVDKGDVTVKEEQEDDQEAVATPTVEATITPSTESARPSNGLVTPLDIFSYVRHTTIPSGCVLPPGAEFTKTWTVSHFASGHEYDFDEVKLVLQTQGKFGPASRAEVIFKASEIKENNETEVSIAGLRVPDAPNAEVLDEWRFEDANGKQYGQPLRLRIFVEGNKSGASSMASSAVIMPGTPLSRSPYVSVPSSLSKSVTPAPSAPSPAALSSALSNVGSEADAEDEEEVPTETEAETEETADEVDDFDVRSVRSMDSFIDVDGVTTPSGTSGSIAITDDREEFDFVDTESDEETADELE